MQYCIVPCVPLHGSNPPPPLPRSSWATCLLPMQHNAHLSILAYMIHHPPKHFTSNT